MSFTVTCDNCGNSLIIANQEDWRSENIDVYASGMQEAGSSTININCSCGNNKDNDY